MKRVSRVLFTQHAPAFHGLDVVVLMRKRFRQEDFARFLAEFDKHVLRVQKCRNVCVSSSAPTSTESVRG